MKLIAVVLIFLTGVVAMPALEYEYEAADAQPYISCPSVMRIGYEALDGSTVDDPYYPYVALRIDDSNPKPFLVVEIDSKEGVIKRFWFDTDRDGMADDSGDGAKFLSKYSSSPCDLAKLVK